jgi:hypothetical protein
MKTGAEKICVITSNILCGNSILTKIITAIENKRQVKELCKAHNKAQKNSIMPEVWQCEEILLFKEIEHFISYESRKREEQKKNALSIITATQTYSCCTPSNTMPFIFLDDGIPIFGTCKKDGGTL